MRACSASIEPRGQSDLTHVGASGHGAETALTVMGASMLVSGGVGAWIGYKTVGGAVGALTGAFVGFPVGLIVSALFGPPILSWYYERPKET